MNTPFLPPKKIFEPRKKKEKVKIRKDGTSGKGKYVVFGKDGEVMEPLEALAKGELDSDDEKDIVMNDSKVVTGNDLKEAVNIRVEQVKLRLKEEEDKVRKREKERIKAKHRKQKKSKGDKSEENTGVVLGLPIEEMSDEQEHLSNEQDSESDIGVSFNRKRKNDNIQGKSKRIKFSQKGLDPTKLDTVEQEEAALHALELLRSRRGI